MLLPTGITRSNRFNRPGLLPVKTREQEPSSVLPSVSRPLQHASPALLQVYFGNSRPTSAVNWVTRLEAAVQSGQAFPVRESAFTPEQQQQMLAQVERDGFLRLPPQEAINKLSADPVLVLSLLKAAAKTHGTLSPSERFQANPNSPQQGKAKTWFSQTPTQVLNLAGLTRTNSGNEAAGGGDIWKGILYMLSSPAGVFHLMPWHEKDLNSNYIPNNPFRMDPGLESKDLKQAGIVGTDQLRLLADVGHHLGKSFVYDLLPHSAHFGAPALLKPELFRWTQFNLDNIRRLPPLAGSPQGVKELYRFDDLRRIIRDAQGDDERAKVWVEAFINSKVETFGILQSNTQDDLVRKVRETTQRHLGKEPGTFPMEDLTPEKRQAITQDLIGQGIWSMPRHGYDAWNYRPLIRGYNVEGNYPLYQAIDRNGKGDANGQMFPFTRLAFQDEQGKLRNDVVDFYAAQVAYADKLGLADVVRLDQVDWLDREQHVFDPLPSEAVKKLTAKFPQKVFVGERLESWDLDPYRRVGVNVIVGNDWRNEINQSGGPGQDFFHQAWNEDARLLETSRQNNQYISVLRAFQIHDQHMQPREASPFDLTRGGIKAGQARLLTYLFLNGDQGSNKPYYGIIGDEVALWGKQVFEGSFIPNKSLNLTDNQNFYPVYANAMSLRYGSPLTRKVQAALKTQPASMIKQTVGEPTFYAAKAQEVMSQGRKTWDRWSTDGDIVSWAIERADNQPGKVVMVVNRQRPDSGKGATRINLEQVLLGSGKGVEFRLNQTEGMGIQPIDATNGLSLQGISPSEVRLYYFE